MTWARFDDLYDDNRKVKRAWRRSQRAVGLHAMAITYSARHGTDGLIDMDWLEEKLPKDSERSAVLRVLVDAGLFDPVDDEHWQVHDFLDFNPSSAKVEADREWDRRRKELHRDPDLVAAIRERDQDRCRYCGTLVNWKDRRGSSGATYDHVIPRGPNTLENVVVACRYCNTAKNCRTPEQAGMPLLAPGQMGSSSEAGSGLDRSQGRSVTGNSPRPDPTRPDPISPQPPASGGLTVFPSRPGKTTSKRRRDQERSHAAEAEHRAAGRAFAAEHFPDEHPDAVLNTATVLAFSRIEPTVEAIRERLTASREPQPESA